MNRREAIIQAIAKAPSLPTQAVQVIRELQDPLCKLPELSRKIELDPGLTSMMLRLANSAYFGCQRSIVSVRDAVVRLGINNIFKLVISFAASGLTAKPIPGYELAANTLWEHSVAVAIGSERLAERLELPMPQHLFSAAMLHDIGKIVIGPFIAKDIDWILESVEREHLSFEQAEQQVLGIDHAEVGALLLESWSLPPCICEAVRGHHNPQVCGASTATADLIHIADILFTMAGVGVGRDGLNYHSHPEVIARIHLPSLVAESVLGSVLLELGQLKESFLSPVGGHDDGL